MIMSDEYVTSYVKRIQRDECACCGSRGNVGPGIPYNGTLLFCGIPLCFTCASGIQERYKEYSKKFGWKISPSIYETLMKDNGTAEEEEASFAKHCSLRKNYGIYDKTKYELVAFRIRVDLKTYEGNREAFIDFIKSSSTFRDKLKNGEIHIIRRSSIKNPSSFYASDKWIATVDDVVVSCYNDILYLEISPIDDKVDFKEFDVYPFPIHYPWCTAGTIQDCLGFYAVPKEEADK